ncbi:polyketide synthase dehydratase domain-containing protein, partial [Nocardia wallacei]|uniref:polyketide synthase dehydratase domain-containing protein n=1 Tax=Nocardia wallacei TaxID=480035 RepID=UPI0024579675
MDLDYDAAIEDFRLEVREFLRANVPAAPLPSMDTRAGFEAHRAWERTLADARLSVVSWARAHGGRAAAKLEWVVLEDEFYAPRAQALRRAWSGGADHAAAAELSGENATEAAGFILHPVLLDAVLHMDTVDLDGFEGTPVQPDELLAPVLPEHPAYVIFTSGSTG